MNEKEEEKDENLTTAEEDGAGDEATTGAASGGRFTPIHGVLDEAITKSVTTVTRRTRWHQPFLDPLPEADGGDPTRA